MTAVIDHVFSRPEIVRVYAEADARNLSSRRVLEKLGLRPEGTLRGHRNDRDIPADEVWYGILREEWDARRA